MVRIIIYTVQTSMIRWRESGKAWRRITTCSSIQSRTWK